MKKLFKWILRLALVSVLLGVLAVTVTYLVVAPDLPDVQTLRTVQLQVPLRVYTRDGKLVSVFGEKRRLPVAIEEIPADLKNAFIAGEDARFYEHPGVDYQGLTRAALTLLLTGERTIGGSTITQQLAKNFFLSFEKTIPRKIKEIFLALRIERELEKDEILELYLNKIFLGYRAYGVGAAADVYYGKPLDELTLAQTAMIAAIPKAPSRINPIASPERALERRNYVLNRMLELGYIDRARHDEAIAERDLAYYHGATAEISAPYLAEMVRRFALAELGEEAYTGGYEVYTTIDSTLQAAANSAVERGLEDYDHRHGYRGPHAQVDLDPAQTVDDWNALLEPYRPVAGLLPALVTEVDDEIAMAHLADGQTIALTLDDVRWARPFVTRNRVGAEPESVADVLAPGDVIRTRVDETGRWQLGQVPETEAALVSLDPQSGAILALVGGYDYARSKFNRVTQSRRQPGSSFKPFVYSAALERGYTTASIVTDAPIVFEDSELERTWKPENFEEKFYGPTRLREAMVNSRNLVSIRLLRDIGIDYAREHISHFGFDLAELPANLSMALGTAELTPLSMARGYAVFANGGYLVEPYFVDRVLDADGRLTWQTDAPRVCDGCEPAPPEPGELVEETPEPGNEPSAEPRFRPLAIDTEDDDVEVLIERPERPAFVPGPQRYAERAVSAQNAYLVRSMMMDVIRRGTGRQALSLERSDLAGKTGTTNDQRDAWFSGYNDDFVTTVWVGFDDFEPLGRREVGGRAALPVWIQYMATALRGSVDEPPGLPPGLAQARIDPDTGLLTRLENPGAIVELFEDGRLPPMEGAAEGVASDAPEEQNPYDIY